MFDGCSKLTSAGVIDMRNAKYQPGSPSVTKMFEGCTALTDVQLKNIYTYGVDLSPCINLSLDSIICALKELRLSNRSTFNSFRLGPTNLSKIDNIYVKLIDVTEEMRAEDDLIDEKLPCEVCESTDEGAMLITDYVAQKGWALSIN
jgi:hypothetical protein